MTSTIPRFVQLSLVLSIILGSLIGAPAFASGAVGKPNPDCPQFAPAGFPFPIEAKIAQRAWHVCHKAYSSYVDPVTRTPLWSAEEISGSNMDSEEARTNDFRPDPDIPASAQARSSKDYARSGYDQGHLAPAGDFRAFGSEVMSESFYFSNIVPQNAHNNRHAWQKLEIFTRQWAKARGKVHVVTGPLYSQGKSLGFLPKDAQGALAGALGATRIAIPTHMFKVVIDFQRMESVAFVLPNEPISPEGVDVDSARGGSLKKWEGELSKYVVSIRDLEAWSGLRFNAGLQAAQRDAMHGARTPMWSTHASGKKSRSR